MIPQTESKIQQTTLQKAGKFLRQLDTQLREQSICFACGKPRKGLIPARSTRVSYTRDDTGAATGTHTGGGPVSLAEARLCECILVTIRTKANRRPVLEGLLVDYQSRGTDWTSVNVLTPDGYVIARAENYTEPMECIVFAPGLTDQPIGTDLIAPPGGA